jgi:hypothetical protein
MRSRRLPPSWDFISRIEAGGVRYRGEAGGVNESELLSHLQADFVSVASKLEGTADGILLLIDEADKPSTGGNLGLLCKLLTEELSRRGCERLCIGLAGLPSIISVLRESHISSLRIFKTMELRPLEPVECAQVVDAGIIDACKKNGYAITVTHEAKELLATLSEGYPHFLQEFAYCAFEEDTDNTVDQSDVLDSLFRENGSFDQLGRKYFAQYYEAPSSDDYRKVLDTMAAHFDEWIGRATIIEQSGLKPGTVDNALRALKTKQIIFQNESKMGQYRLPTRSFATWIKVRKRAETATKGARGPGLFDEK